jgi:hypothetical protein
LVQDGSEHQQQSGTPLVQDDASEHQQQSGTPLVQDGSNQQQHSGTQQQPVASLFCWDVMLDLISSVCWFDSFSLA